ncbi:MAG TPA: hypothetical protein H9667_07175 [Firmicutes bacterium]|nr:hypothetical protein [Bacillales bacterium]HJA41281.1 hypothetical protein [Bacillota bacterium]
MIRKVCIFILFAFIVFFIGVETANMPVSSERLQILRENEGVDSNLEKYETVIHKENESSSLKTEQLSALEQVSEGLAPLSALGSKIDNFFSERMLWLLNKLFS